MFEFVSLTVNVCFFAFIFWIGRRFKVNVKGFLIAQFILLSAETVAVASWLIFSDGVPAFLQMIYSVYPAVLFYDVSGFLLARHFGGDHWLIFHFPTLVTATIPSLVLVFHLRDKKRYEFPPEVVSSFTSERGGEKPQLGFVLKSSPDKTQSLISIKSSPEPIMGTLLLGFLGFVLGLLLSEVGDRSGMWDYRTPIGLACAFNCILVLRWFIIKARSHQIILTPSNIKLPSGRLIAFEDIDKVFWANPALDHAASKPTNNRTSVLIGGTGAVGATLAGTTAALEAADRSSRGLSKFLAVLLAQRKYHVAIQAGAEYVPVAANLKAKSAESLFNFILKKLNSVT